MKKTSFSGLIKISKPYKKSFIIVSVLSLIFVFCSLALPVIFGEAVNFIVKKSDVNFKKITKLSVFAGCLILIAFIAQRLLNVINNRTAYNIVRDLRKKSFEKIQKLPLGYLDSHSSGDLVARIMSDADRVGEGLLMTFEQLFTGVITII
ncbi:MAG TPA: sugar ABC transporter ATP-binding protein, partial [Clostridiales bacterium]|nr:sugar ABC transporter ATP-binding protein [Clostridiales bacterium]